MATERERELIAAAQDRLLRDADSALYADGVRTCGTCGGFDRRPYRDCDGEVHDEASAVGICVQLDIVCECEAPGCRWWSG